MLLTMCSKFVKCMKKYATSFFLVYFNFSCAVLAQEKLKFYIKQHQSSTGIGFRGGINYSISTVTSDEVNPQSILSFLGGVRPQTGYYIGGFYYKDLSPNQLTFRMEATLQRKGVNSVSQNGVLIKKANYYFLGFIPILGLHLLDRFVVYTGPELNILLTKHDAWGNSYPVEIGALVRFQYTIRRMGIEGSYFRGFTRYDRLEGGYILGGPSVHDFYNQNFQVGITYNLR